MNRTLLILLILLLLVLLLVIAGCVPTLATRSQGWTVRVLDAESGQPLANATIDLHYFPSAPEAPNPDHPQFSSNEQGEVQVSSGNKAALWQVRAANYIEQRAVGQDAALPPQFVANASAGVDGAIYLYQLPAPQLTIVVAEDYSGPLTIKLQPAAGFGFVKTDEINVVFAAIDAQASRVQEVAGQRHFTATASADGIVELVVTPLLYELQTPQVQVQAGSELLPYRDFANPQETARGVWGAINEDEKRVNQQMRLFVGDREEYMAFQRGS